MHSLVPTLAELHGRHRSVAERQVHATARVSGLAERQGRLGASLGEGIASLQACVDDLSAAQPAPGGAFGALLRPFGAFRASLARRSAAESLQRQYEAVGVCLREALAFTDELQAAALELQAEVEDLHRVRADSATEVARLLAAIEAGAAAAGSAGHDALRAEQLTFQVRTDRLALQRLQIAERMAEEHLGPARALRDTALALHEHMAGYVASASRVLDRAGGRVAVVGLVADATGVVADLHGSMRDLEAALAAAERYVADSRHLLGKILPELAAELDDREASLLRAAEAEVEAALARR